jgi:hypothetical protein
MTLTNDHNQCPTCSEYFNSTYAFDKHRVGSYEPNTRRCLETPEMELKGMVKNSSGFWLSEVMDRNALSRRGDRPRSRS